MNEKVNLSVKQKERNKRKGVFLDRDGVLNIDKGYIYRKEDFIWVDGAREAIKLLNDRGYMVFVVTNQSGIARGFCSEKDVSILHKWINEELQKINAKIDAFYYCPHHPEAKVEKYRVTCNCRKPAPGLILQAISDWYIDKSRSFLIGDSQRDIEAAEAAGIEGFLFDQTNLQNFVKNILIEQKQ